MQLAETACRAGESAGLTQTELARRMGTTQSAIAAIETGARTPTVKLLERLARARGGRLTIRIDAAQVVWSVSSSGFVTRRRWRRVCAGGIEPAPTAQLFASGAATTAVSTPSQQRPDELPGETAKRRALRSDTSGRARAQACRPA
ncbi:helix-turn-helix transcriptional regulator [Mycobacterium malmoense]|uniref:helix-turn-helix transcriptional regulator n=1 Tax=Mycobacterium malmoense TaxID=1780 RepID=UPI0020CB3472|nr:helix-turn-helix transcriptional regulator [Mycobacterium malmoense]